MDILIVGGSGFLGTELVRRAAALGYVTTATYRTRRGSAAGVTWQALDLRDAGRVDEVVAKVAPHVVVNATTGGSDREVTADGAVRVAAAAARYGCRLIQVSSDAVFSGAASVPYDESCRPDPVTAYGAAKAEAEAGIGRVFPEAVIARTSLIVGDRRSKHVSLVHELAAGARAGVLYTDDIRCPVDVTDLAAALLELAAGDASGVHHLAGPDAVSRHQLGLLIAARDGLDASRLPAARRADHGLPGPLDIRLDSRATQAALRTVLRGARQFLAEPSSITGR